MIEPRRLVLYVSCSLVTLLNSCSLYTIATAPGTAHGVPRQFFGVGPGDTDMDAFRRNGWVLADSHDNVTTYLRNGDGEMDVSEAEAIVVDNHGHPKVDYVRLRFSETRLATWRDLVNDLVRKHGSPQESEERPSFPQFVLDPKSEHPLPDRVVVHRWRGGSADLVLVGGIEVIENLKAAMDYQILLMPPRIATPLAVP